MTRSEHALVSTLPDRRPGDRSHRRRLCELLRGHVDVRAGIGDPPGACGGGRITSAVERGRRRRRSGPSRSKAFDLGSPDSDSTFASGRYAVTLKNTGTIPHDVTFADGTRQRRWQRRHVGDRRGQCTGRRGHLHLLGPGPCPGRHAGDRNGEGRHDSRRRRPRRAAAQCRRRRGPERAGAGDL